MSAAAKVPFYFLCHCCEAKWFAAATRSRCPRCGARCRSDIRALPPWLSMGAGAVERARAEDPIPDEQSPRRNVAARNRR